MLFFYMDHHVPMAITVGLRQRRVDVLTASEDGAEEFDDNALLDRATALGRVLFTQDEDFLAIAHQRITSGPDFAGIVYSHQLAISIGEAIRDLELVAKVLDASEMRNRTEYLPF